ncbi:flagellar M-ring protein FliF [Sulfuriferula multivorans]|uniref:Flagellar M-ring protein n=1 Tax=Sulfuriferula multivorans TaxID=1559896 RepID=A0A401JDB0_9PROT|nr:flagellar basal-body MS-ring/collar protein FliF [Sulfuriferula multivorans]GBL45633.1 flagellar M-ring protein FliF [Sulfuriferula multivorans]
MSVAGEVALAPKLMGLTQGPGGRKFLQMLAIAAVVAIMAGVWMWGQQPDYRVLFSNFSDRDGGAIVASLQQMNVPYKFAEGGGAILVPANQVYEARLKLASQGLPKGGNVGFELMENQKLGVSQFLEQVNFQRALEGELARSIESISAVLSARVLLALPKSSVFVREQQKPTASVLLNLQPGRVLDQQQVSAIVHLVASSVPELPTKNVTIVDQNGNLLSDTSASVGANGLDPSQLKYIHDLQRSIVKRVESIITPIVGASNVHAEATADVDFSHSEQAAETYKPNQTPDAASIRSQQTSETLNGGSANATGVPGALSNQPPAPATAPLTAPAANTTAPGAAPTTPATNTQKESTVNYELDKTVRYVQQPMGGLKRLSVAVVVNYRDTVDKSGKVISRPLSAAEKTQITDLVKEAMGYNQQRGDTLNVVNSPFAGAEKEVIPDVPLWKQPENIQLAKDTGKYLIAIAVLLYLFFGVLKPMLRKLSADADARAALRAPGDDVVHLSHMSASGELTEMTSHGALAYQQNLEIAKSLAKQDPKIVANVVKAWVNGNE